MKIHSIQSSFPQTRQLFFIDHNATDQSTYEMLLQMKMLHEKPNLPADLEEK